jgi:hypothetical protein
VHEKADDEAKQGDKAAPIQGRGGIRAETRKRGKPYRSSLLEMRNMESYLIIMRVGRNCQARGTKVRFIHHRERLYHQQAAIDQLSTLGITFNYS